MSASTAIALRPLAPNDGAAIATLFEQTPDAGQVTFTTRFKIDAATALTTLHEHNVGVVATLAASEQIVGMAMVDLSQRQIEGAVRPCALINTLKVHPDYRRQGIAARLSQWCIDYAHAHLGAEAVMLADIQKNNTGSQQTARRWCSQFVGEPVTVLVQMRSAPPSLPSGIAVRVARPDEYEQIAAQQNRFYAAHQLYEPQTAASLAAWQARTPLDQPLRAIYVAVDAAGRIVAGAGVTERARVMALHVGRLPRAMHLVNRAIRLLPPNGVVDEVLVDQLWFAEGQIAAARALWEWLRWHERARGSVLHTAYDGRGLLPTVLQLPFWLPKARSSFAVQSPIPLRPERLLYPYG